VSAHPAPTSVPDGSALERTRFSWMRTSLATIIVGFLLVRGWLTDAEPWTLAGLAVLGTLIVLVVSMSRFQALGGRAPSTLSPTASRLVALGIVLLAGIALVRLIITA